jgi:hypothetical protein
VKVAVSPTANSAFVHVSPAQVQPAGPSKETGNTKAPGVSTLASRTWASAFVGPSLRASKVNVTAWPGTATEGEAGASTDIDRAAQPSSIHPLQSSSTPSLVSAGIAMISAMAASNCASLDAKYDVPVPPAAAIWLVAFTLPPAKLTT